MEKSEPSLIPEWLKSNGTSSGGGATHHIRSDDRFVLKPARIKSSLNASAQNTGHSSYSRQSSSSNGIGHSRSYNSFGRSNRDTNWGKDIVDSYDKEESMSGFHRNRNHSDLPRSVLPSRLEKDALRRSQSMTTGKRGETWPRKGDSELSNSSETKHNGNGLLSRGSAVASVYKAPFARDFPSLGGEEKQGTSDVGRVSTFKSLPLGSSAVIGGDGWRSTLADVPERVGNNSTGGSVQQTPSATSSVSSLNMAETLAQAPSHAHITPQLSAGTQKLEELALKQSRQLIPMTPSVPKTLVLNPSEKTKPKIGQLQPIASSHVISPSTRVAPKSDISKTSSGGKLHVLKPARERNGVSSTDSSSPKSVSEVVSSPLANAPSVGGFAPLRSPSNNGNLSSTERKPTLAISDRRPTSQAQSRNEFFNSVRKNSLTSSSAISSSSSTESSSALDKSDNTEPASAPVSHRDIDDPSSDISDRDLPFEKKEGQTTGNDDASDTPCESLDKVKIHSRSDSILCSEEEETAFLRSMGWEENAEEDEGLTEEEISAFYSYCVEYIKMRPSSKIPRGLQPKFEMTNSI